MRSFHVRSKWFSRLMGVRRLKNRYSLRWPSGVVFFFGFFFAEELIGGVFFSMKEQRAVAKGES